MARAKFAVGEAVEMYCRHLRDGRQALDWLPGRVTHADERMVAVVFAADVFTNTGWMVPDRTLWCTHGSRHLRRVDSPYSPAAGASPGRDPQSASPSGPGEGES